MNTPAGNRPDHQQPARAVPLGAWNRPGFKKRHIDTEQRSEIREKFTTAREDNPAISKAEFARNTAPDYGVSGATIIAVLAGI